MSIKDDFDEIVSCSHWRNCAPDWDILIQIYQVFPDSYSVLTPFAYTYLEELIRSTTSQYGREIFDDLGNPIKKRKVGMPLINLAIKENKRDEEFIKLLEKLKDYFAMSKATDLGDNRNSVTHGYMHARY